MTQGPTSSEQPRRERRRRFGQGNDVDRAHPHLFHRDYWPLKLIRRGVEEFFAEHADELRGQRVLDFGSGDSP
ncbi:MAG TPA: hypothetical protein VH475_28285, partial [Tepidisphaeraceae bacterium]